MIIGILNQKGGVGKTTIAVNLASYYAMSGNRVLLVDADPQASSLQWSAARQVPPLFPVVGLAKDNMHLDVRPLAKNYDVVIIDGAPCLDKLARSAIIASDLIVIPVQPSALDIWATDKIVGLVREAQVYNPGLKCVFALNRKIANTAIGRSAAEALANFPDIAVIDAALHQRVAYSESIAQGLAVMESDPKSDACREFTTMAENLEKAA